MHKTTLSLFLILFISFLGFAQNQEAKDMDSIVVMQSIKDLRNGKTGVVYTLTNEVILTYQQDHTGQKYIQDASGAILVEDSKKVLTNKYNIYDGISGITGKLSEVAGVKTFIPSIDAPKASSSKNQIVPKTLSIKDYLANPKAYESQLIRFKDVSFPDTDGSMTFAKDRDYELTDGRNYLAMRTNSSKADYIGALVPDSQTTVSGIATHSAGKALLLVRELKDLETQSAVSIESQKEKLSLYPNPATDKFYIIGSNNAEVEVFSVIGKQVARAKVTNKDQPISLQNLRSGVYMVRISQEGSTTTKKLIVK